MKRVHRVWLPLRVWVAITVPFALIGVGTVGYKATGGPDWTWFDALYMTAITLTTVGYGETHRSTIRGGPLRSCFCLAVFFCSSIQPRK